MNSEEIILMKMADIVFVEKRPFSLTFYPLNMKIGDKFKHGTIRNTFSRLRKRGDIEYEFRAGPAFYTLPRIKFGKSMTVNHTEVVFMMVLRL